MPVAKMRSGADLIHQLLIHEDAATGTRLPFDHGPIIFSQVPLPPFRSAVVKRFAGHYCDLSKLEYRGIPSSRPNHPLPFYLWEGTQPVQGLLLVAAQEKDSEFAQVLMTRTARA